MVLWMDGWMDEWIKLGWPGGNWTIPSAIRHPFSNHLAPSQHPSTPSHPVLSAASTNPIVQGTWPNGQGGVDFGLASAHRVPRLK
jgi:hypothetical protein